jgi:hypothetical protein
MKEHPDRQPSGAKAVRSGDNDPNDSDDQFFDDDWIDSCVPGSLYVIRSAKFSDAKQCAQRGQIALRRMLDVRG